MIESPFATTDEVAKFLRISAIKLAKDRQSGIGIPFTRIGTRILYRWEDVTRYVDANTTRTV